MFDSSDWGGFKKDLIQLDRVIESFVQRQLTTCELGNLAVQLQCFRVCLEGGFSSKERCPPVKWLEKRVTAQKGTRGPSRSSAIACGSTSV